MNAPQNTKERSALARLLAKGQSWEDEDRERDKREIRIAWRVAGGMSFVAVAMGISLATLAPLRRTIPYLVHTDAAGNVEVLQTFDNRLIGTQELHDLYWANRYVLAREQYNWWLVEGDYDFVFRTTDESIREEYTKQFQGLHAMDKDFGADTDRRIKIISVVPSPTLKNTMVVRFTRTTITKGQVVEPPTPFIVNMSFKYKRKTTGPLIDLIQNPDGYDVYAYRRDPEIGAAVVPQASSAAATSVSLDQAQAASGVAR